MYYVPVILFTIFNTSLLAVQSGKQIEETKNIKKKSTYV